MQGKAVVIFGGSGAIGSAAACAFSRDGAFVYLGGRTQKKMDRVASEIRASGGNVDTFIVDVLDERSTMERVAELAHQYGGIDIVINATSFMHNQGKEIDTLSLAEFRGGFDPFLSALFNIAKAVMPFLGEKRGGTFMTMVAPAGPMAMPGHLGHIVGCAATEAFIKALASELGPKDIRVLGLRSHAITDAVAIGSYTGQLFAPKAQAAGLTVEQWLGGAAQTTMLKRLPTLSQVAETLVFLASDHAGAMTAAVLNMTAGATTD